MDVGSSSDQLQISKTLHGSWSSMTTLQIQIKNLADDINSHASLHQV